MKPQLKITKCLGALLLMFSLVIGILVSDRTAVAHGNQEPAATPVAAKSTAAEYSALTAYATDLTKLARQGKLDPVKDHDKEIRQMARILSRDASSTTRNVAAPPASVVLNP